MLKELTIRMKCRREHFTVGELIRALERTLEMLRGIEQKMPGRQRLNEWEVSDLNANGELRLTVKGDTAESLVQTYMKGMRSLEDSATIPTNFDETDLSNAKRLVSLLDDDVESITFSTPGEDSVSPTQHVAANVDAIMKRRYLYSGGTIEGRLETFNVHGTNTFTIYDVLTDEKTVCEFPESLYSEAYGAVSSRVAVTGRIKYNRDGRPVSMTVESIRKLREAKDLPQIRSGEQIDITGGIDSVEYIRKMRDAE